MILNPTLRATLALAGVDDPSVHTAFAYFGNFPLAVALGSLLYYILFLLTGRRWIIYPVAVLYALYLGYLLWYTVRVGERHLVVGEWQAQVVGEVQPTTAETIVFGVLLAAPILITLVAYGTLIFRVSNRTQRYRLAMVNGGFLLLFGTVLLGFLLNWNTRPWFPLAYELPALATSLFVVWAYRPPQWVQHWLHVEPIP